QTWTSCVLRSNDGCEPKTVRQHHYLSYVSSHCTGPSNDADPLAAGPSHSTDICHAPAMPNSADPSYRPMMPVGLTSMPLGITIPGMRLSPVAPTVPTPINFPPR